MTVYIPWGLIAIGVALYYFYAYNRASRLRKEERREELNNRRQELLGRMIQIKKEENRNKEIDSSESIPE